MTLEIIFVIVMLGIMAVYCFRRKLLLKRIRKHDQSGVISKSEIISEERLQLLKKTMLLIFSEDIANYNQDKIESLIGGWNTHNHAELSGYIVELADLLEECTAIDWQSFHIVLAELEAAANTIITDMCVRDEVIEKCQELLGIYECLTAELVKRDFRE